MRTLDLFLGTGSVRQYFQDKGYELTSQDQHPRCGEDIQVNILEWDVQEDFEPGTFDVIFCSTPCTEYSQALMTRRRNLILVDAIVRKALEVIDYLSPRKWFLENPRYGLLESRSFMRGIPYLDVDYCQFGEWGYQKPTRIWGREHLWHVKDKRCLGLSCPDKVEHVDGSKRHRERLDGNNMSVTRKDRNHVPASVIDYIVQD